MRLLFWGWSRAQCVHYAPPPDCEKAACAVVQAEAVEIRSFHHAGSHTRRWARLNPLQLLEFPEEAECFLKRETK